MKLNLIFEAMMDDERLWQSLNDYFQPWEIWEIRKAVKDAENLGAWGVDIIPPQLLVDNCTVACTFYSREVAEVWWSMVKQPYGGGKFSGTDPRGGYRAWVEFKVN